MSKFKPGDRVRHMRDPSATATILAVHDGLYYWYDCGDRPCPYTAFVTDFDSCYELIPESFLPNGDLYCIVYANGDVSDAYSSLDTAETVYAPRLGIICIDGQTGELSWAKGGPK